MGAGLPAQRSLREHGRCLWRHPRRERHRLARRHQLFPLQHVRREMSKKTLTRAQRMALIEVAEQYMAGEMEDGPNPDVLTRAVHWLQDTMPHDNDNDAWVRIGSVGVDAGMLYIGDPCYIHRTPLGRSTGAKAAWPG